MATYIIRSQVDGERVPVQVFPLADYRSNGPSYSGAFDRDFATEFACVARVEDDRGFPSISVIRGLGLPEEAFAYVADDDVWLLRQWPERMPLEIRAAIGMEDSE